MTLLALRGIMHAGFSFGIDDEDIPKAAVDQIEETTRTAREKSRQLIEAYNAGELEPLPGRTLDETLEMRIMQTLGKARDTAGKIAGRHLGLDNSGVVMAVSGAASSRCAASASCAVMPAERSLTSDQETSAQKRTALWSQATKAASIPQSSSSMPSVVARVWWIRPSGHPRVDTCSAGW